MKFIRFVALNLPHNIFTCTVSFCGWSWGFFVCFFYLGVCFFYFNAHKSICGQCTRVPLQHTQIPVAQHETHLYRNDSRENNRLSAHTHTQAKKQCNIHFFAWRKIRIGYWKQRAHFCFISNESTQKKLKSNICKDFRLFNFEILQINFLHTQTKKERARERKEI